jgi:sulfur-oxidizing protein SoxZ
VAAATEPAAGTSPPDQPIRIRARVDGPHTDVTVLMPHPMETGFRHDSTGQLITSHFITTVEVSVAGRVAMSARMGPSIAADPLLRFRLTGVESGQTIRVTWIDNQGQRRTDEAQVA